MNVGFIGTGNFFTLHLLGYKSINSISIRAFSLKDAENVKKRAKGLDLWESINLYSNYTEMFTEEHLDIIDILTPPDFRLDTIRHAGKKGVKAISLINPIAHSLKEADKILKFCKSQGIFLSICENTLFAPHIWKAKELIENDYIGDIASIRIKFVLGKEYEVHKNFSSLIEEAWSAFSLGYWLFNEEIEKVFAWAANNKSGTGALFLKWKCKTREEHIVPKYGNMEISYLSQMEISSTYYPREEFIEIIGSRGLMKINQCTSIGNSMTASPVFSPLVIIRDGKVETINEFPFDLQQNYANAKKFFVNAFINAKKPILSGNQARDILKFYLAANQSIKTHEDVYLEQIN